jgi:hypothetical protein
MKQQVKYKEMQQHAMQHFQFGFGEFYAKVLNFP